VGLGSLLSGGSLPSGGGLATFGGSLLSGFTTGNNFLTLLSGETLLSGGGVVTIGSLRYAVCINLSGSKAGFRSGHEIRSIFVFVMTCQLFSCIC